MLFKFIFKAHKLGMKKMRKEEKEKVCEERGEREIFYDYLFACDTLH